MRVVFKKSQSPKYQYVALITNTEVPHLIHFNIGDLLINDSSENPNVTFDTDKTQFKIHFETLEDLDRFLRAYDFLSFSEGRVA